MACGSVYGQGGGCGRCASGNGCSALHVFDWLSPLSGPDATYDIVEVRFKGRCKGLYRNADRLDLQPGDYVIVEADRGVHFGVVHLTGELVRLRVRAKGLDEDTEFPRIVRLATLDDIDQWEANKQQEIEAFYVARQAIEHLDLPMKLVDAEWQFDRKKITFYFTADHRVDFRQLVRDLARTFRTRVELRQIGARDEAARIGGIGSCGRELCCATWMQEFQPVATQAAKAQNLPLNPARLSGQCGRLKCCLNYELEQYMAALKDFPPVDTPVETARGQGTIQKLDIFKRRVWIQYEDGSWEDLALEEAQLYLRPGTTSS